MSDEQQTIYTWERHWNRRVTFSCGYAEIDTEQRMITLEGSFALVDLQQLASDMKIILDEKQ